MRVKGVDVAVQMIFLPLTNVNVKVLKVLKDFTITENAP